MVNCTCGGFFGSNESCPKHGSAGELSGKTGELRQQLAAMEAEVNRLRTSARNADDQFFRIATCLGGDARQAPSSDPTIAGLVIAKITRLRRLLFECVPYIEVAMPEISRTPFPGPNANLDCDDMNLAMMCDLYQRVKKEARE